MKRREVIIDLHGVKNEIDVILRFAKALNLKHGGLGWTEKSAPIWAAFFDDMSAIYFHDAPEIKKVLLTINGMGDVAKNVSEKTYFLLVNMLSRLTDPANQIDLENGMDFLFRIRED